MKAKKAHHSKFLTLINRSKSSNRWVYPWIASDNRLNLPQSVYLHNYRSWKSSFVYKPLDSVKIYGVPSGPKFNFWILLVLLAFDVVVLLYLYLHLQFNIQVSNFSTPIDDLTLFHNSTSKFTQFNIQVYNSTSKFTQFNIQVYAIQHPSLHNSTFNFGKCLFFDIQPQSSQWQSVWAQKTIKILPV